MSFNIATRLNNLQYQINQKTNNPLTTSLNCGGFDIENAGTINYTTLNPPVGGSAQNLDETLTAGPSAGGLSIIDLSAVVFSDTEAVNQDIIISQLPGLGGRLNIYQESDIISPFNSSATIATGSIIANSNITVGGNLTVGGSSFPTNINLDGTLTITNDGPPLGSVSLTATTSNSLSVSGSIETTQNLTCSTLNYTALNPAIPTPNLSAVLSSGNSAGGASISNVNQLTVSQLNYTTLNPPVGGSAQNLQQVLTTGNNAGGEDILNCDYLEAQTGSFIKLDGAGNNGLLQIGQWTANNWVDTIPPGTIGRLTLGNAELNMSNNYILNVPTPINTGDAVNKSYVDNRGYPPYTLWYPLGLGGAGIQNIPNSATYSVLWQSPSIPTYGRNARVNIQLTNTENGGGSYANVIESVILVGPNSFAGPFTPTNIFPYNQVLPARGFYWGPSFNGWFNIDASTFPSEIFVRIGVRQQLISGGYDFNGSDVILTVYPL